MRTRFIAKAGPAALLACTMLAAPAAMAADYPVLRGSQFDEAPPPPREFGSGPTNWGGFYFGGMAAFLTSKTDAYSQSATLSRDAFHQRTIGPYISDLVSLGKTGNDQTQFGGFVGYNVTFGDAVLGVEAEYLRANLKTDEAKIDGRIFNDIFPGTLSAANVNGSNPLVNRDPAQIYSIEPLGTRTTTSVALRSQNQVKDFAVLKARAGYAIGNFMPFFTIGAAVGKMETKGELTDSNSTNQYYNIYDTAVDSQGNRVRNNLVESRRPIETRSERPLTTSIAKSGYVPGLALGGGLEALLGDNILVRAEVQRIYFSDFKGTETIVDTARVGAGLKF